MDNQTVTLHNGVEMPLLGLGVFRMTDPDACRESVCTALRAGCRLVDTAAYYGNEAAVGAAVRESGLPREAVFLTSKVWVQDAGYDRTLASFEKTLANLGTPYLDLYLIHMPYGDYHGSWRAMERLLREGRVRAIGVCNFLPDRLADLILTHGTVPAVEQMELHPFCQQRKLRLLLEQYRIRPMAWAPFARGQNGLFEHPVLAAIGAPYGKTPAQVVLRWLLQEGVAAIPKSARAERIRENLDVWDFALSPGDMAQIQALDLGRSLLLDVPSLPDVYRLHRTRFVQ